MIPWLNIIGAGEGELPTLPEGAPVIGPARFERHVPGITAWRSLRLDDMVAQVLERRGNPTTLLASGDPLWFGFAATLSRHIDPSEFSVRPAASSFQLAAAEMRWPMQHLTTLSLHARPVELLHPHLAPGARILTLTADGTTARDVAALLVERGYGETALTVLENLGGSEQRMQSARADNFDLGIGDFYVLAIDCVASADAPLLPPVPGLPDEAYESDGQLTKREVRAITLARLAPYPGALLWDVGAGCGSVAIEWMRAGRDAAAIAIEREPSRAALISGNAMRLGVPSLRVVEGEAPAVLADLPQPDAIFLGGDVASEAIFDHCWSKLRPAGRLVANAVTIDGEQALFGRQQRFGGELVRIDVAALDAVGGHQVLRPRLPVTQWAVRKS